MPRLKAVTKEESAPAAGRLMDEVKKTLGSVPNIMRTMANAPAVLEAYLGFSNALAKGSLPAKLREQIALTVGQANDCGYCLAAHSLLGRKAGLGDDEIEAGRRGTSADEASSAALAFARKVVTERGRVGDDDLAALRLAGFDDGAVAEIVAHVGMNIFTNYFNHVAETEVDFPEVAPLDCGAACAHENG